MVWLEKLIPVHLWQILTTILVKWMVITIVYRNLEELLTSYLNLERLVENWIFVVSNEVCCTCPTMAQIWIVGFYLRLERILKYSLCRKSLSVKNTPQFFLAYSTRWAEQYDGLTSTLTSGSCCVQVQSVSGRFWKIGIGESLLGPTLQLRMVTSTIILVVCSMEL